MSCTVIAVIARAAHILSSRSAPLAAASASEPPSEMLGLLSIMISHDSCTASALSMAPLTKLRIFEMRTTAASTLRLTTLYWTWRPRMVTVGGGSSRASLASFCSGDLGGLDCEAVDSGLRIANAKLGRSEGSGRRGELAGLSTIRQRMGRYARLQPN